MMKNVDGNLLLIGELPMTGKESLSLSRILIEKFLQKTGNIERVLLIPSLPKGSSNQYIAKVAAVYKYLGYPLYSIYDEFDRVAAVKNAEAIAVVGEDIVSLLDAMNTLKIMTHIRDRCLQGIPYMGWGAGSIAACPALMTTNDMPIVKCLNLIPFQINTPYVDENPAGNGGKSRDEKINEFLKENPDVCVTELETAGSFEILKGKPTLIGANCHIFRHEQTPWKLLPGKLCDFLMAG